MHLASEGPKATRHGFFHAFTLEELADARTDTGTLSSGYLEMLGIIWWLRYFSVRCRTMRVLLESDSKAACLNMSNAHSDSPRMMLAARTARILLMEQFINIRIRHIRGRCFNTISDHISRDRIMVAVALTSRQHDADLIMLDNPTIR